MPALGTESAGTAGNALAAAGLAMAVVGAYFGVEAQKDQLRSEQSAQEHQATISGINASAAEDEALFQLWAGEREQARLGMSYAQVRAETQARIAGSGVRIDTGSAAEVLKSIDFAKESDRIAISLNSIRAANAARMQAVGYRIRGASLTTAAGNTGSYAGALQPWIPALSTAAAGGASLAGAYARNQREERYYANRGV